MRAAQLSAAQRETLSSAISRVVHSKMDSAASLNYPFHYNFMYQTIVPFTPILLVSIRSYRGPVTARTVKRLAIASG